MILRPVAIMSACCGGHDGACTSGAAKTADANTVDVEAKTKG